MIPSAEVEEGGQLGRWRVRGILVHTMPPSCVMALHGAAMALQGKAVVQPWRWRHPQLSFLRIPALLLLAALVSPAAAAESSQSMLVPPHVMRTYLGVVWLRSIQPTAAIHAAYIVQFPCLLQC